MTTFILLLGRWWSWFKPRCDKESRLNEVNFYISILILSLFLFLFGSRKMFFVLRETRLNEFIKRRNVAAATFRSRRIDVDCSVRNEFHWIAQEAQFSNEK